MAHFLWLNYSYYSAYSQYIISTWGGGVGGGVESIQL
jgi:hypothetical protein